MYALFERIDERLSITRSQIPSDVRANKTSVCRPLPVVYSIEQSKSNAENSLINRTYVPGETILFVYFNLHVPLNRDLISRLRAINNDVKIYSDSVNCLEFLRYSNDRIFFISSSNDKDLIKEVHDCITVEAIFILNSDVQMDKNRFRKLFGIYLHSDELLFAVKNTFEWFEQTQMEFFAFEDDQLFLWFQLWKEEEWMKLTDSKVALDKEKLVNVAENYYRGNTKLLESLDDFDYCYGKHDVLQWCFSSPFPSRFLRHALNSHHIEHLDLCRFLITDVSHVLQRPMNLKTSRQFYRGMKLTSDVFDRLIRYTGKLICSKGFFTCTKSRKAALMLARSPTHRSDLRPVLFKVNCDPTVFVGELSKKDSPGLIVFDVYTVFRVKNISRDSVLIVKIQPADEDGRNQARAYRMKHRSETVRSLLDQLSAHSKPTIQPPLAPRSSILSDEEIQAQTLVQRGEIDQALILYQNLKFRSTRVLNTMGQLYADKKGDYKSAVKYHKEALDIQEKNGEDSIDTLTQLGIAHYNRQEFDLSLAYHNRALDLKKDNNQTNQSSIANSLIGIANAQWGQDKLSEALSSAQQALIINESIQSENDSNLAMNLAVLANIHHKVGDDVQALEFAQRALTILERCISSDSLTLASVLNNMGAIQLRLELFSDAQYSFERALKICENILPQEHPKRMIMKINIQRIKEIIKNNENNLQLQS